MDPWRTCAGMCDSTTNPIRCRNDQILTVPWRTDGIEDSLARDFSDFTVKDDGLLDQAFGKYPKALLEMCQVNQLLLQSNWFISRLFSLF